jgi:hypothetical protein
MRIGAWRRRESWCDVVKEPAKMESKRYVSPSNFTGAPAKLGGVRRRSVLLSRTPKDVPFLRLFITLCVAEYSVASGWK